MTDDPTLDWWDERPLLWLCIAVALVAATVMVSEMFPWGWAQ